MQTPIRQKRPNLRIPYFAPPNAVPCTVPHGADAPLVPLPAATGYRNYVLARISGHYAFQGHPKSLILIPIESPFASKYYELTSYLVPFPS